MQSMCESTFLKGHPKTKLLFCLTWSYSNFMKIFILSCFEKVQISKICSKITLSSITSTPLKKKYRWLISFIIVRLYVGVVLHGFSLGCFRYIGAQGRIRWYISRSLFDSHLRGKIVYARKLFFIVTGTFWWYKSFLLTFASVVLAQLIAIMSSGKNKSFTMERNCVGC